MWRNPKRQVDITWNWPRRARILVQRVMQGQVSTAQLLAVPANGGYKASTLLRIYMFITQQSSLKWQVQTATRKQLRAVTKYLKEALRLRNIQVTVPAALYGKRQPLLVIPFLHTAFEKWMPKLSQILDTVRTTLPFNLQQTAGSPKLAWSYDRPIRASVLSAASLISGINFTNYKLDPAAFEAEMKLNVTAVYGLGEFLR